VQREYKGPPGRQCKAHLADGSGDRCINSTMHGQLVCYNHGGANARARAAGARRVAEAEARELLNAVLEDAPPMRSVGDVYEDLLSVAGVARTWRELLQKRVAQLEEYGYNTERAGEQLRSDVALFERALDRSAKIGEAMARLNLDERRQALDERVAGQLAAAIRLILEDLDLTPEQQKRAAVVAPRRIRELSSV